MARLTKTQLAERAESLELLRKTLAPGETVYTVMRHVSRSGMSRDIDVYKLTNDGPLWLTYHVAKVLGYRIAAHDRGLKIGGCGMDMGFAIVYELGHALWPNGTEEPHGTRNGEPDRDGGYALKQRWM